MTANSEQAKQNHEDVFLPAHLQELYLSVKDLGLILSQKLFRLSPTQCQNNWVLFFVMVIYLENKIERLNSGLKDYHRNEFGYSQHWSDEMWKSKKAGDGSNKKKLQHCTDPSGQEIYLRALQGHSRRNPIDPSWQNNVLIPNNFFEYIHHIGCAINLHSISNSRLITGGQNLSKDKRYSLRLCIPWTRITKIRTSLTWPIHVLHRTSRRSGKDTKTRCIGSIYSMLSEKDWSSVKQDVMQSSFTTHSQFIVSRKLLWWNLEKSFSRKYMCRLDLHGRFGCVLSKIPCALAQWGVWPFSQ